MAGIEPDVSADSFDTLFDQKSYKTVTPDEGMKALIHTFRTYPQQKDDTFLHRICEIYAKWSELPLLVQQGFQTWDSLPEQVRTRIQELLEPRNND